jgi:quercetin dioxygenase-like cupin family protein
MKFAAKSWEIEGFEPAPPYNRNLKVVMAPETHGVKSFAIIMVTIPPGVQSDFHSHEGEEFWIVTEGRAEFLIGDEKFIAEPGMVVFSPPKIKHQITNNGKDTFIAYSVHCPPGPERVVLEYMKKKEAGRFPEKF